MSAYIRRLIILRPSCSTNRLF